MASRPPNQLQSLAWDTRLVKISSHGNIPSKGSDRSIAAFGERIYK